MKATDWNLKKKHLKSANGEKSVSAEKLQGFSSVGEYKPLNKYCYYSLLDTLQKCLHCWTSKKPNRALIQEIEGRHFDLLTGRDRFSCRGPGTGTNYEKRVNGTRYSFRKFQPGKRAHLFRFSTFSGNFPVGRTDETCSIYPSNRKYRKFWLNGKRPLLPTGALRCCFPRYI